MTYLMAKSFDKPMVLLPTVVVARFQHAYALYNAKARQAEPADLNDKRVGIRSFTTTTGAWLRGILANDHGVDLDWIDWVTFEDAHVAEIVTPRYARPRARRSSRCCSTASSMRCSARRSIGPALGRCFRMPRRRSRMVRQARRAADQPYGGRQRLPVENPSGSGAGGFAAAARSAALAPAVAPKFSDDEMRRSLELIIRYTAQQGLIPRAYAVDELFDDLMER